MSAAGPGESVRPRGAVSPGRTKTSSGSVTNTMLPRKMSPLAPQTQRTRVPPGRSTSARTWVAAPAGTVPISVHRSTRPPWPPVSLSVLSAAWRRPPLGRPRPGRRPAASRPGPAPSGSCDAYSRHLAQRDRAASGNMLRPARRRPQPRCCRRRRPRAGARARTGSGCRSASSGCRPRRWPRRACHAGTSPPRPPRRRTARRGRRGRRRTASGWITVRPPDCTASVTRLGRKRSMSRLPLPPSRRGTARKGADGRRRRPGS